MKKIINLSIFLFLIFFLLSCAGTGSQYLNTSELNNSDESVKIFIYREKAFIGSGLLATILLNNVEIGKLGNGEYTSSILIADSNTLKVETKGFSGIGIKDFTKRFTKSESNFYYLVTYETKLLSPGWKIIEISKNEFESYF